jgi:uncharacterized protein DUF4132
MSWLDAAPGYQVRLDESGKVVCRNAKGKQLAGVPGSIKDNEQVVQLRQLAEWLQRHESECHATVDRWMVRSLPVPTAVIAEVWPDPAWQSALRDLVITVDGEAGFLRDADVDRGVGVVTLDGDTRWAKPELVRIPHPVLLADLDDLVSSARNWVSSRRSSSCSGRRSPAVRRRPAPTRSPSSPAASSPS